MTFEQLEAKVIEWAYEKGIMKKATKQTQFKKTWEEVEELENAIKENDKPEVIDGIRDVTVTLIIQAHMNGLNFVDCLESAYNVISKRTGKMVDGVFVKDK